MAVAICDTAPMSEFSAREIVASYIERIWNRGDSSAVLEFCADPYTRHDAGGGRVMSHTDQLHRVTSERVMGTARRTDGAFTSRRFCSLGTGKT